MSLAGRATEPSNLHDFARANQRTSSYQAWTLARLVERVSGGEELLFATREFLDDVYWAAAVDGSGAVVPLVAEEPAPLDERTDAFVAALAEHFARQYGFGVPEWAERPQRFMTRFWFPHRLRAFDGIALRDAPAAFRRRNVYLHPSFLDRV